MAGLAQILKESGHDVSGADAKFYPPMSDYLKKIGIKTIEGYEKKSLPEADLYVIGNALSRGNECVEEILDQKLPYVSGPEMLGKELKNRNVFAISGTHGKTTTSYMLAHIFLDQGREIGYLVGGISDDFDNSACLGKDPIFVIEADEYDSAFFDKRSKFIHYSPTNLIINNIEFDHADIFNDIEDIKKQFHHLGINSNGVKTDFESKELIIDDEIFQLNELPLIGEHNFKNYVCSILAAKLVGISETESINSLKKFKGVKRRMDFIKEISGIRIYDDFAHHPTAIKLSCSAIRNKYSDKKILGLIELGSNTMSSGYHKENLINSFDSLDEFLMLDPNKNYKINNAFDSENELLKNLEEKIFDYDIILIMTNKDSRKFINPIINSIEKK